MKKTLLFFFIAFLFIGANAQTKVGYFGMTKAMPNNDPLLVLLQSDVNFTVTTNYTAAKADVPTHDLSVYDVIIIQESIAGDAAILFPANSLGLSKITKPFLYNKSYAFKAKRALESGTSTGAETEGVLTITVEESAKTNDLFKACTYVDATNDIKIFESGADDSGLDTKAKALNYTTGTVLSPANTPLASVTGIANQVICFNDIPSGTDIDGQVTAARMMTVGMNFGALTKTTTNLTDNGLTILRNAVYMLAGLTVPSTKATLSSGFKSVNLASSLSFDGENLLNANAELVNIFNVAGKLIATSNDKSIDLSEYAKGIYLVKSQTSKLKVSILK